MRAYRLGRPGCSPLEHPPYGESWIDEGSNKHLIGYRFTGKELDDETGLYYYGARYFEPSASVWLSADPAIGNYLPQTPVNDEARKRNGNLPGMGGVYNPVNLALYHYAGNNPVKYMDPDGRETSRALQNLSQGVVETGQGTLQAAAGASGAILAGAATAVLAADDGTLIGILDEPLMIATGGVTVASGAYGLAGAQKAVAGLGKVAEGLFELAGDAILAAKAAIDIGDFKSKSPSHPDYAPPKNWNGERVKTPRGAGWPAKNGDVWVPTDHKGTHAQYWDVQHPDGTYDDVYPVPETNK